MSKHTEMKMKLGSKVKLVNQHPVCGAIAQVIDSLMDDGAMRTPDMGNRMANQIGGVCGDL